MSNDQIVNAARAFKLNVEDIAQKWGEQIPGKLAELETWLKKKKIGFLAGSLVELRELLKSDPAKMILRSAAGILEIPRSAFPQGQLGDALHEYAEEFLTEIVRGLTEEKQEGKEVKADDTKTAGTDSSSKPPDPLDPNRKVYVIDGDCYPVECTHRKPPAPRKGESKVAPLPLRTAIQNGHLPGCRCFGRTDDIDRLVASILSPKPAAPEPVAEKPAPKEPAPAPPPVGGSILEIFQRLTQDVDLDDEVQRQENEQIWRIFVGETERDPDLKGKFITAASRGMTDEQFERIVFQSPVKDWHSMLDFLVGNAAAAPSYLANKTREEGEQWAEALKSINDWLDKANAAGLDAIKAASDAADYAEAVYYGIVDPDAERRSRIAELRKKFPRQETGPAFVDTAKKWIKHIVWLAILLVAWYFIRQIG